MDETKNPWKTLSNEVVYDNPWIEVSHRDVINPSGNEGIYGKVHYKNKAVGVIPLDEDKNTWIVGQYRYTLNEYSWEIPEGGGKIDEDPIEAGKRELLEETGIQAKKWDKILESHLSNSVSDEAGVVYLARDLTYGEADPEETEDLQIKKLPFSEVVEMAMKNEITDALAVAAIFKLKILLDSNSI